MNTQAIRAKLQEIGAIVVPPERRSPEYLQEFLETEIEKWSGPIKSANIRVD
jgi:hypothetical protein